MHLASSLHFVVHVWPAPYQREPGAAHRLASSSLVAFPPTAPVPHRRPMLKSSSSTDLSAGSTCYYQVTLLDTWDASGNLIDSQVIGVTPLGCAGGGAPTGSGSGGGSSPTPKPPPATIQTSKGVARLTNCTNAADAAKQAMAQANTASAPSGGSEYGSAVYEDASGNYYILDTFTQGSDDSVDFSGLQTSIGGLSLVSVVHDHYGFEDGSTPPQFTEYNAGNWQVDSIDGVTQNHFSLGDENVSESFSVPIFVVLGNVNWSFSWNPPPKDNNGSWNQTAPDNPLGQTSPSFHC